MSLNETSKFLALILRHKPEVIGITLDRHGWAKVEEVVAGIARQQPFDRAMLEEIVRTDSKQRYSFNEDHTLIRANQGHSLPVDVELAEKTPPEVLWHGTGEKYTASIDTQIQAVCASVRGLRNRREGGGPPRQACGLPGCRGRNGEGRLPVLSVCKRGVADQRCACPIFKANGGGRLTDLDELGV